MRTLAHARSDSASDPGSILPQQRNPRRNSGRQRRGATLVEFAVVAPLLFLFILGMLEFGRMVMVEQFLTNAAREGARRGILEQTTASDVEATVTNYLTGGTITGATVTVSPAQLTEVGFGDPVSVAVSVPYDQASWLPTPWFLSGITLSGNSVMQAERPE
jgi:Flp pilus assembly protein TadG